MATTPNADVASNIRAEMARRRTSAREVSRRLDGRSSMWVLRRVNGDVALTIADVHEIARALDVEPSRLLVAATTTPPEYAGTPWPPGNGDPGSAVTP